DPAVLAPPTPESEVRPAVLFRSHDAHPFAGLPALGLEVLDVDVLARLGVGDHAADVLPVLDHGVTGLQVLESNLVADRNVMLRDELGQRIVLGDHTQHVGAGFEVLDDDNANAVLWAMHEKLRNLRHFSSPD